jgi:hypothetical protein
MHCTLGLSIHDTWKAGNFLLAQMELSKTLKTFYSQGTNFNLKKLNVERSSKDLTVKFMNSSPCACHGSSGQKPQHCSLTMAYQRFTAVLLIYGSFFLSGVYYCLSVFWCTVVRMSELELEHCLWGSF